MIKGTKVVLRRKRLSAIEAIALAKEVKELLSKGYKTSEVAKMLDIHRSSVLKYSKKDLGDL